MEPAGALEEGEALPCQEGPQGEDAGTASQEPGGGGGGGRGRGMESAFECKRVQSQGRREARGVKGQAQQPWNLSSDSSEPAPGEGQVDLTEKLSEDGEWKRYGGNGGREG